MKIFVGVANDQDFVPSDFFWSWEKMIKSYPYEMKRIEHSWSSIRNNLLVDAFLKSDCDICVKMDCDQKYPENYFEVMIPLVQKYKVIGPIIHNKWKKNRFVPLLFSENQYPARAHLINVVAQGVVEVPYSHSNLFCLREVWEKIPPPWYEYKVSADGLRKESEPDFDVLSKIKDAGYPIYTNTDMTVEHLVHMGIGREEFEKWY